MATCPRCKEHNSSDFIWYPGGKICYQCAEVLRTKIQVILNLDGVTSDEYGIILHWHEIEQVITDVTVIRKYVDKIAASLGSRLQEN